MHLSQKSGPGRTCTAGFSLRHGQTFSDSGRRKPSLLSRSSRLTTRSLSPYGPNSASAGALLDRLPGLPGRRQGSLPLAPGGLVSVRHAFVHRLHRVSILTDRFLGSSRTTVLLPWSQPPASPGLMMRTPFSRPDLRAVWVWPKTTTSQGRHGPTAAGSGARWETRKPRPACSKPRGGRTISPIPSKAPVRPFFSPSQLPKTALTGQLRGCGARGPRTGRRSPRHG